MLYLTEKLCKLLTNSEPFAKSDQRYRNLRIIEHQSPALRTHQHTFYPHDE